MIEEDFDEYTFSTWQGFFPLEEPGKNHTGNFGMKKLNTGSFRIQEKYSEDFIRDNEFAFCQWSQGYENNFSIKPLDLTEKDEFSIQQVGFKKFFKKHKAAILITAAVVLVAGAVFITICSGGTGTGAAGTMASGAVGAAGKAISSGRKKEEEEPTPTEDPPRKDPLPLPKTPVPNYLEEFEKNCPKFGEKVSNLPPMPLIPLPEGIIVHPPQTTTPPPSFFDSGKEKGPQKLFEDFDSLTKGLSAYIPDPFVQIPEEPTIGPLYPEEESVFPTKVAKSTSITMPGEKMESKAITFINGIANTLQDYKESVEYLHLLSNGKAIEGVYNKTHGALVDLFEVFFLNDYGNSPVTADLLREKWIKFHEVNRDNPDAKLLHICHSQGALHTINALQGLPEDIRDDVQNRVLVVAIAPATIVSKNICYDAQNIASKDDWICKRSQFLFLFSGDIEGDAIELMKERAALIEDQVEMLDPHPNADDFDHAFRSPTFADKISEVIESYLNDALFTK